MEQTFESILKSTLVVDWGIVAFVFFVALVALVHDIASIPKSNKKQTIRQKTKRYLYSVSTLTGILFVVCITISVWNIHTTVPVVEDIINNCFCSVHGEFVDVRSSRGSCIFVTSDNGEEFSLYVPSGAGSYRKGYLPSYNEYSGTMWYSKNSEYALIFVPDKGDWRFWEGQDDWW